MSDRDAQNGQPRLLRALIWAGVGLAPVAALVVLLGSSAGPTRFGVLLVAVSVVLLGAALLIRNDPVLLRMDVEDRVTDEVNALRDELRSEIAASRVRSAPVFEPGQSTGGRAAVAAVEPEPRTRTGGRVASAAVRPPAGGPVGGRATVPPLPDPVGGRASVGVAAPVPGQRGRATAAVPPPMAPVFRAPAPVPPGTYGTPQQPDQGGRRRADVTAIDLGYTGRRAKPEEYDDAGHGGFAEHDYGYGDPEPGYPGWAEADERYRADADPLNNQYDWRGRDRTGGW